MDPFGNGAATAQNLYERAIRLSGIVPGDSGVAMISNRVVEREGAALGFATESAAWSNAWLSSRTTHHAHPWIDNAGWISKTLPDQDGAWSAYAYHLQNELWFRPATSVWYSPAAGVTARIARVLVGSLGDWCLPLVGEQVPFAHHLGPAWTNGPRGYLKNESVSLQPDLRTYYKIVPELFWPINDGDGDGDGIPGFADGFNLDGIPGNADDQSTGDNLLPWRITIPDHLDPACVNIQLDYPASPPHEASSWLTPNNPTFTPTGPLRLWRLDGNRNRIYVPPGNYPVEQLGLITSHDKPKLYIEAIYPVYDAIVSYVLTPAYSSCYTTVSNAGGGMYDGVKLSIFQLNVRLLMDTACDGESMGLNLIIMPTNSSHMITEIDIVAKKSDGSSRYDNPAKKGIELSRRTTNTNEWYIDNARLYSTQPDYCNSTSSYIITTSFKVASNNFYANKVVFTADLGFGSCADGAAQPQQYFSGDIVITTTNVSSNRWFATVGPGNFKRDVTATAWWSISTNSQYYSMIRGEEEYHRDMQLQNPAHTILKNYWKAESIISATVARQPFAGLSEIEARQNARDEFELQVVAEVQRSVNSVFPYPGGIRCAIESEAKKAVGASHRVAMPCTYPLCP